MSNTRGSNARRPGSRGSLRLVPHPGTAPPETTPAGPTGHGECGAHHGELLRGAFWLHGPHRPPTRALVCLPYPELVRTATAQLRPGTRAIEVDGDPAAVLAARLALAELRQPGGASVRLRGEVPAGQGGATADVVATIRAVAAAAGRALPPATLARLTSMVLRTSDATMFGAEVTLYAHREGRAVGTLGPALPPLLVVGCETPASEIADRDYGPGELDQLGFLLATLRRAVRTRDARLLGAVATRSALIDNPGEFLAELNHVAGTSEAVGVQVSHSGSVAGLLYDAADPRAAELAERGRAALERLGTGRTWAFRPPAAASLARAVGQ
jgi:uncharacterized protein involved in propanediol utilization